MGNEKGGSDAFSLTQDFTNSFNGVFLFNASPDTVISVIAEQYYYVDVSDKADSYSENFYLYNKLHEIGKDYEYRVHQGEASLETTLYGLDGSINYLSRKLKNQ